MEIKILKGILGANEAIAARNRDRLDRHGILTVNIMASPGAGKTSLVLQTIERLKPAIKIAVIEGDVASSIDADRVSQHGVPVIQINTDGGCHLDANMIENALNNLSHIGIDLLLIENVGNLICPAEFALGEHRKVMLSSTPEGDDKPYKYPLMFTEADVVLVNKVDLLPYLDFNIEAFKVAVTGLNPDVEIFPVSCKTGEGLEAWFSWLESNVKQIKGLR
ncbi:MAG: hydrogenase nickel incorporation protein HypB, partial [Dehalococcoidales bacterium]|nr:hydrogenase nickel incorporation protein HypB [Dehalococcoidales bacterium]